MTSDDGLWFPEGSAQHPRRWRRRLIATSIVLAAVIATAAASFVSVDRRVPLRTATAGVHDVASTLHGVVSIEPVVQAAVAFPSDGTVSSVDVSVGDTVAVGQSLASLDQQDLTESLHVAEETLAQAELTLSRALDGEVATSTAGGATPTSSSSSGTAASAASAVAPSSSSSVTGIVLAASAQEDGATELEALQQDVLVAQQVVDDALAASASALASAEEVCPSDATSAGEVDAGASATTTTTTDAADDDGGACSTALAEALAAQRATAESQLQLAAAADALDSYLLSQEVSSSDGSSNGGSAAAGSGSSGSDAEAAAATSSSPSSEQLIALQREVDTAALGVAVARQAVAQAAIVSPIAGTVVVVGVGVGDEVTAASATQTITVQGEQGMEAVTTLALADVASVEVGRPATVVPDGSDEALEGEVVAVSAVPDDDATTTSYRVTIGFVEGGDGLGNGTTGSVSIVTADVRQALAVPTSAVTWQDGRPTVQIEADGEVGTAFIEVGVVGPEWTEVLAGVERGDEVVLADPSEPLPGSATDTGSASSGAAASGGGTPGGVPGGMPTGPPGA
jgi:multidrug efflux pump subunit AcrA (membrane-fusion protein)